MGHSFQIYQFFFCFFLESFCGAKILKVVLKETGLTSFKRLQCLKATVCSELTCTSNKLD